MTENTLSTVPSDLCADGCQPRRSWTTRLREWLRVKRGPRAYRRKIARTLSRLAVHAAALEEGRAATPALYNELMRRLPRGRDEALDEPRFANLALVQHLLDRSGEKALTSPAQGEELAQLGLELARRLGSSGLGEAVLNDLEARALTCAGLAASRRGETARAEKVLTRAKRSLDRGSGDPLASGELFEIRATLDEERHELALALSWLDQAIEAYREAGDLHLVGRVLLRQSTIYELRSMPSEARRCSLTAAELLDDDRDPGLAMAVRMQHDQPDRLSGPHEQIGTAG